MIDERQIFERLLHDDSRDSFCVKKRRLPGETDRMGYTAFGVIFSRKRPIEIYLRSMDGGADFAKTKKYNDLDAMLADGWIVD